MKFWRAVLTGALLWILIFFEVSVLMFGFGLQQGDIAYVIINYVLAALFILLVSVIYFRKAEGGVVQGLLLGIIYIVVGSLLDLAITVPLFTGFAIFNIYLFVGYMESLVLCMLFGLLLGRKGIRKDYSIGDLKKQISSSPSFERTEMAMPASVSKLVMDLNKRTKPAKKKSGKK